MGQVLEHVVGPDLQFFFFSFVLLEWLSGEACSLLSFSVLVPNHDHVLPYTNARQSILSVLF